MNPPTSRHEERNSDHSPLFPLQEVSDARARPGSGGILQCCASYRQFLHSYTNSNGRGAATAGRPLAHLAALPVLRRFTVVILTESREQCTVYAADAGKMQELSLCSVGGTATPERYSTVIWPPRRSNIYLVLVLSSSMSHDPSLGIIVQTMPADKPSSYQEHM